MTLRSLAEGEYDKWVQERADSQEARRAYEAADSTLQRMLTNLMRSDPAPRGIASHRVLPDEPEWHGRRVHRARIDSGTPEEWFFLADQECEAGPEAPDLYLIDECPDCGRPVVMEPAFATLAELGRAMRYGKPSRHDCPGVTEAE